MSFGEVFSYAVTTTSCLGLFLLPAAGHFIDKRPAAQIEPAFAGYERCSGYVVEFGDGKYTAKPEDRSYMDMARKLGFRDDTLCWAQAMEGRNGRIFGPGDTLSVPNLPPA